MRAVYNCTTDDWNLMVSCHANDCPLHKASPREHVLSEGMLACMSAPNDFHLVPPSDELH